MLVYKDGNRNGVNTFLTRQELGYNNEDIIHIIRSKGKDYYLNWSLWIRERQWYDIKREEMDRYFMNCGLQMNTNYNLFCNDNI